MQVNSILQGVLFYFLLMTASYEDIKKREIPDLICIFIVLIGFIKFNFINLFGIFIAVPFLAAAILKENSMVVEILN